MTSVKKDGTVKVDGNVVGTVEKTDAGKWRVSQVKTVCLEKVEGSDVFRTRKRAVEELLKIRVLRKAERKARGEAKRRARKERITLAREEGKNPLCLTLYAERIRDATPEGWTAEIYKDEHHYDRHTVERYSPNAENKYRQNAHLNGAGTVILRSESAILIWRLSHVDLNDGWNLSHGAVAADGSTFFEEIPGSGSWRTFDRRGIDSSFHAGSLEDPAETVTAELHRIEKARERGKKMISIPEFGWRVHADDLPELKRELAAGKSHSFTPAGFGTGYRVSIKRPPGRYGVKQLPNATAEFFGVPVLWAESLDCD